MSDARTVIYNFMFGKAQDMGTLSGDDAAQYAQDDTDAILTALAEAGFVLMKADAVTKHKAWCPALSQCECEGSE